MKAVLIDFGSTFTKVAVVCLKERKVIVTAKFPSTVKSDARIAMEKCFDVAKMTIGQMEFEESLKLASSSAAGGLRMAVVGLTKTLSNAAARNAAFSGGAKIVASFSGKLSETQMRKLEEINAEILLFCGGYENGNASVVLHNAEMLAMSNISFPIIYGGNSAVAGQVKTLLAAGNKECFMVPNVIPDVGQLYTGPAEEIIRNVFMKRIINMKGLGQVSLFMNNSLMPTPSAVLKAGKLLSLGSGDRSKDEAGNGLGAFMLVDIGGATTDIHSYGDTKAFEGAKVIGAVEPYAKRTVEGDLGMRESSDSLMKELGWEKSAKDLQMNVEELEEAISHRMKVNAFVATSQREREIDQLLACGGAGIAARRHGGKIERVYASNCLTVQKGKNLRDLKYVIGTGGAIIGSDNPVEILKHILIQKESEEEILLPEKAEFLLDGEYLFYAAGLLSNIDKAAAFTILKNSLIVL